MNIRFVRKTEPSVKDVANRNRTNAAATKAAATRPSASLTYRRLAGGGSTLRTTVGAEAVDLEDVTLDREASASGSLVQLLAGHAEVNLLDVVTAKADEVMVVARAADAISSRAIAEFDAIENAEVGEDVDGAEQRSPAETRLQMAELVPQILGGEIRSIDRILSETPGDEPARLRVAESGRGEGAEDGLIADGIAVMSKRLGHDSCSHGLYYDERHPREKTFWLRSFDSAHESYTCSWGRSSADRASVF